MQAKSATLVGRVSVDVLTPACVDGFTVRVLAPENPAEPVAVKVTAPDVDIAPLVPAISGEPEAPVVNDASPVKFWNASVCPEPKVRPGSYVTLSSAQFLIKRPRRSGKLNDVEPSPAPKVVPIAANNAE